MDTLWLYRPLLNWQDIYIWAKDAGIKKMLPPDQLHLTLASVRISVDWNNIEQKLHSDTLVVPSGSKVIQIFGWDIKALAFDSPAITVRHEELLNLFPDMEHKLLRPHVSLFRGGKMVNDVYEGELVFGPERVQIFDPEGGRVKHTKVKEILEQFAEVD